MRNTQSASMRLAGGIAAVFASVAAAQTTQPAAATLGLGDAVPPLKVSSWAKGTPVTAFEPGKTYVVEFWATWCAPCKKSIPHLTELAKEYAGKVTFVGVSVWEHPDEETDDAINAMVLPFVKSMGEKMDYNVAVDGVAGAMAATWLRPAKQQGIPTSFVIDGAGKIAWIGHPDQLGPVLEKVTAGTWSVDAEKQRLAAAEAADAPRKAVMARIDAAYQAHDSKAILAAIDDAEAKLPGSSRHPDLISLKLNALFKTDPKQAVSYVQKLTAPGGIVATKPDFVWSIIRLMPGLPKDVALSKDEWKAIATAIDPFLSPGDKPISSFYSTYAEMLDRAGERDLAVFYARKAVNLTLAYHASHAAQLNSGDKALLKSQQAQLATLTANAG